MGDLEEKQKVKDFISHLPVAKVKNYFQGYPCEMVEELSMICEGDWLIYRTSYGWFSHFYVTSKCKHSFSIIGMFLTNDLFDLENEVQMKFRSLSISEVTINEQHLRTKQFSKIQASHACEYDIECLKKEKERRASFESKFVHYSLFNCNSEHLVTYIKTGKMESSQINTLIGHMIKQGIKEIIVKENVAMFCRSCLNFQNVMLSVMDYYIEYILKTARCAATPVKTAVVPKKVGKNVLKQSTKKGMAVTGARQAAKNATKGVFTKALKTGVVIDGVVCAGSIAMATYQFCDGQITGTELRRHSVRSVASATGSTVVGACGTSAGTYVGALLGTVICPGAGTAVGGAIGSIIGGVGGGVAGSLGGTFAGEQINRAFD